MAVTPVEVAGPGRFPARGAARAGAPEAVRTGDPEAAREGDRGRSGPLRLIGPAVAAAAAVAGLAGAFSRPAVAGWVFVGAALIGLPHGAADHVVLAWSAGRPISTGAALRAAGLYAAGVVVALVAFAASPALALIGALAVSAWHFGTTDCAGRRRPAAATAAFGLLPVVGPLALWPHRSAAFVERIAPDVARVVNGSGHTVLMASLIVAVAAAAAALLRRGRRADVGELAVLVVLVAAAPPAVAVGVYFAAWHTPRQVAAILAAGSDRAGSARSGAGRAAQGRRLAGWTAPTTALSLAAIGIVWAVAPARLWPDVALVALLAVSLPHSLVGARLGAASGDRRVAGGHPATRGPAH